jgi:hypothetical protein
LFFGYPLDLRVLVSEFFLERMRKRKVWKKKEKREKKKERERIGKGEAGLCTGGSVSGADAGIGGNSGDRDR